jgi:aliphatic nitrilase
MSETGILTGRAIAYMAKCFVINACGTITPHVTEQMALSERDRRYLADPASLGGSTIIAPFGEIIAGPAGTGDEVLYADADLGQMVRAKLVHDYAGHHQRMDVFSFDIGLSEPSVVVSLDGSHPSQSVPRGAASKLHESAPATVADGLVSESSSEDLTEVSGRRS